MEKSQRIAAQIYGYAVCLVAVITFLIAITSFINAVLDYGDPLHSGFNPAGSPSLASYETYKMDVLKSSQKSDGSSTAAFTPDDQTLHAMYDAAKNDKIDSSRHQANKSMLIGGVLMIICAILFFTHWRWMRKIGKAAA